MIQRTRQLHWARQLLGSFIALQATCIGSAPDTGNIHYNNYYIVCRGNNKPIFSNNYIYPTLICFRTIFTYLKFLEVLSDKSLMIIKNTHIPAP